MEATSRMWSHQVETVKFALGQRSCGLFLGMGAGKTRCAIEVIKAEHLQKILVVAPKNVLMGGVWSTNLQKFMNAPYMFRTLDQGQVKDKAAVLKHFMSTRQNGIAAVVVVSYDNVWRVPLGDEILKIAWDCVILDEAHRIKSPGSKVSKYMGRLGAKEYIKKKIALTGTPNPNSPLDVYGIFRFLDSSVFGTNYGKFSNEYAIFGGFNNYQVLRYKNLDDLRRKMATRSIRFETKDVIDLPEQQDIYKYCEFRQESSEIYKSLEHEFMAEIGDQQITISTVLVKTIRLRQLTGGMVKLDDGAMHRIGTEKLELLDELVEDLPSDITEEGVRREPIIVYCQFTADIAAAKAVLKEKGHRVGEISGLRNDYSLWNIKDVSALVIQIDAGSEGIDLSRAAYAIYFSAPWSLGTYEQSRARIHRPGQTRPTRFIHLAVRGTIDDVMYRGLKEKKSISEYIMSVYNKGFKE